MWFICSENYDVLDASQSLKFNRVLLRATQQRNQIQLAAGSTQVAKSSFYNHGCTVYNNFFVSINYLNCIFPIFPIYVLNVSKDAFYAFVIRVYLNSGFLLIAG